MSKPSVFILPTQTRLAAGPARPFDVLVGLVAAPGKKKKSVRPRLNLAIALDTSGSMAGTPLAEAVAAARSLVMALKPGDRVALVTYSDGARVMMGATEAGAAQEIIDGVLAGVRASGMTALEAGWLAAAEAIAPFVSQHDLSRVLVLSDGNANIGCSQPVELGGKAERLAASGISTSTYGIGHQFNEVLMTTLAMGGQGQAFYAENAESLAAYFDSELNILSSAIGQDISLTVKARDARGRDVPVACLNPLPMTRDGRWRLPMLLQGAKSWACACLQLPKMAAGQSVTVTVEAQWSDGDHRVHTATTEEVVRVGKTAGAVNEEASERAREARAANLAQQAADKARAGDMEGARGALRSMSAMGGSNAFVNQVSDNLTRVAASGNVAAFSKAATYSSNTMSTRPSEIGESATQLRAGRYGLKNAVAGLAATADAPESEHDSAN